ncbi:MAG: glycosyltransferase family 2 protein [Gemmatimonadaceae bacterium]
MDHNTRGEWSDGGSAAASLADAGEQYTPGRIEVSIIIPCLNEAETIRAVIADAAAAMMSAGYAGEIVVIDSGSTDGSAELARAEGARVIETSVQGYGAAIIRGFDEARGEFLVILDADRTYGCDTLHRFVEPLRAGLDIVVGTRRNGEIRPGAMSGWHRHFWEPAQTFLLRRRFGVRCSDVRCGMRSITRAAAQSLAIQANGMEFSSEMLLRAMQAGLQVIDVPVTFHPRRGGGPRRRAKDSWRVIRQLMLLSPTQLFVAPGLVALVAGLAVELALLPGRITISESLWFDYHFMFVGAILALLGFQLVLLGLYGKTYTVFVERDSADPWLARFHRWYRLERGLLVGSAVFLLGLGINVRVLLVWLAHERALAFSVRPVILALTCMVLGAEIVFASFFLSLLRSSEYEHA